MRESERLGRLVEGILRFSRVERRAGLQLRGGRPFGCAAAHCRRLPGFLERSGFRLARELPESTPAVRFDAAPLSQDCQKCGFIAKIDLSMRRQAPGR
jgi:hypothetical protein